MIDLQRGVSLATMELARRCPHPEGLVVDRACSRAYVALSSTDQVAVVNLRTRRLERTLSVRRIAGVGTMPSAVALSPSGNRLGTSPSRAPTRSR